MVPTLLDPSNCTLVLIDYQPQTAFATRSIDVESLLNNVEGLAKTAKLFKVPTVVTSAATKSFTGPTFREIRSVFPEQEPIDRTTMNAWEDNRVVDAVKKIGRKKLVIGGLWTEVCVAMPAIDAVRDGYEVYVVADACGGVSKEAHDSSMRRMEMSGVYPITWIQFMLELQRDWARQSTYEATLELIMRHGGVYGQGVTYAKAMLGGGAAR